MTGRDWPNRPHEGPGDMSREQARTPATVLALPFKPSRLNGLSRDLMLSHYENNYGGALRRLNLLERELASLDYSRAPGFTINGLKREALIAANSVLLHEVYFDNLGGAGDPQGDIASALARDFGSIANWRNEITAMGKALAGGSGWVLLTYSARFQRLMNQWAADHAHHLAGGVPILALDMYEHSYHLDFGANAANYIDAFFKNIHWERVGARYQHAIAGAPAKGPTATNTEVPSVSVEELRSILGGGGPPAVVLDVRLSDDFAMSKDMILSAQYRDPEQVEQWKREIPRSQSVFAYCAYGFEVCQGVASSLYKSGINVHFVRGGIAAWHAIGGPVVSKP
jgi:Fe-Mn family superoxide dismutase